MKRRALAALAVAAWGCYVVLAFRTQQAGFSPSVFAAAAMFVLPAALLPFLGLRWRGVALGAAATVLVAVAAAEGVAAAEEREFRQGQQSLTAGSAIVVQERRWPFSHHYLWYDPQTGAWGAGD
jgi:hypothetical protein